MSLESKTRLAYSKGERIAAARQGRSITGTVVNFPTNVHGVIVVALAPAAALLCQKPEVLALNPAEPRRQ